MAILCRLARAMNLVFVARHLALGGRIFNEIFAAVNIVQVILVFFLNVLQSLYTVMQSAIALVLALGGFNEIKQVLDF